MAGNWTEQKDTVLLPEYQLVGDMYLRICKVSGHPVVKIGDDLGDPRAQTQESQKTFASPGGMS